jgi:surfactin synthase thioesterase subunit
MTMDSQWIRRYHSPPGSDMQLICLPHAGGSASFYLPVSRALAPALDVLAVQYPGRQDRRREPCIDHVPSLAREVCAALGDAAGHPLALFGHSMGASVAFEIARILEHERGIRPVRLFASGRRAPSAFREEFVHLRDDEGLLAEARTLSGTDLGILGDEEMLRAALPALRSDHRAAETYRYQPGPPLSCPITVFAGDADPKATLDEARAWREHTTGSFDFRIFSGGHFFLTRHQSQLLEIISDQLSSAPSTDIPLSAKQM